MFGNIKLRLLTTANISLPLPVPASRKEPIKSPAVAEEVVFFFLPQAAKRTLLKRLLTNAKLQCSTSMASEFLHYHCMGKSCEKKAVPSPTVREWFFAGFKEGLTNLTVSIVAFDTIGILGHSVC